MKLGRLVLLVCLLGHRSFAAEADFAGRDRSPVDLVLSADESRLLTVNQTSNSVSLVDVTATADKRRAGRILDEIAVGDRPVSLALIPGREQVAVTASYDGHVTIVDFSGDRLRRVATIPVGFEPQGVVVSRDGQRAFVARFANDDVALVDLAGQSVVGRIPVGRWPRYLALSPNEKRLAVGTSGDRGLTIVDVETRSVVKVERFVGLNIGHLHVSADGQFVHFPWIVYRRNSITAGNIRLGWVLASRLSRAYLDRDARREALSLDPPGKAVADPHGIALTRDEQQIVVTASGSHELLVFHAAGLPYLDHGSTDHIDAALLKDRDRFFRIELGGRPMGVRIARDDRTAFVANYLDNSVQIVDLQDRAVAAAIPLGGAAEPSLARRGEAIFYDGRRSLDQWYSCHSCHYDGSTSSVVMDTENDGTSFTFKSVLPLHHLRETSPWTWHGWQKDLQAAMHKSLTSTMLGPPPTPADGEALLAYFDTLRLPKNPFRRPDGSLTDAAERGRQLFHSETAACAECHSGPRFTDGRIHDLGVGRPGDAYKGFNTPTLIGAYRKVLFFHDGRSESLADLLSGPHEPSKVRGTRVLTKDELNDLVEYVRSL